MKRSIAAAAAVARSIERRGEVVVFVDRKWKTIFRIAALDFELYLCL